MARKARTVKRKCVSPNKSPRNKNTSTTVPKRRGRPGVTDIPLLTSTISLFKERLFDDDGNVVSRSDYVWHELSKEFDEAIRINNSFSKPKDYLSMYTYVVCNKNGIRSSLRPHISLEDSTLSTDSAVLLKNQFANDSAADTTLDLSDNVTENVNSFSFIINVQGCDFDKLTEIRESKDKSRATGTRKRLRFKKDEWSRWCNEKIYSVTRTSCGFYFHFHHISTDGNSGHIAGYCNCGTIIDIILNRNKENVVSLKCTVTNPKNKQKCGKVYLRGDERMKVGTTLQKTSTYKYRTEKLDQLMDENDDFEPAIVPNSATLHTAKSQVVSRSYLDADPLKAVQKMQLSMKDVIYNIGLSPVFVHYSTKHQDTIYKTIADRDNVSVAIDATGSIVRKMRHPDKSESGPIFLYAIVVRTPSSSCIIAQMLSEKHNTTAITHWLNEWISNTGVPCPKEVVCDSSKALLAACVRSFTNCQTISEYADALAEDIMPSCYIRIDVAHFIKNYADFLKGIRREVRKFYLCCIGRLIICEDIEEAKKIIHALFVVSLSDYDGPTTSGDISECEKQKSFLINLLTNNSCENFDPSNVECDEDDDCDTANEINQDSGEKVTSGNVTDNKWSTLGRTLEQIALFNIKKSPGTRVNAYQLKKFFERLLEDLKLLPLWSCIVRNNFGYGRIPATSAHVESEFNKIKNLLLENETLPMRLDVFINLHIKHLSGVLKQFNVVVNNENYENNKYQTASSPNSLSIQHEDTTSEDFDCNNDSSVISPIIPSVRENKKVNIPTATLTRECMLCQSVTQDLSTEFLNLNVSDTTGICNDCNNILTEQHVLRDITLEVQNESNQQLEATSTVSNSVQTHDSSIVKPIKCPACQQGDTPTGNHTCIVCGVLVHALDLCSKPYGEEGYRQSRICNHCSTQNNVSQILESREQENWKGQVSKSVTKQSKPKNCYLKKTHSLKTFTSQPILKKIPIFKKGDDKTLKAVRDGRQRVDYSNTCAFDALLQLFLVASMAVPSFYEHTVQKFSLENSFCHLITKSKDKITAHSYLLRANILKSLFPKHGIEELGCYTVNCASTVKELSQKLLKDIPSFVEIRKCKNGHEKIRTHTSLTITKTSLISTVPNESIEQELSIEASKCLDCNSTEHTTIEIPDNFVVFAIVPDFDQTSLREIDPDIMLKDIPYKLELSFMKKPFYLRGLINFLSASMTRTTSTQHLEKKDLDKIGHYTTFYYMNGKWLEFDSKEVKRPDGFKVNPELVMYSI